MVASGSVLSLGSPDLHDMDWGACPATAVRAAGQSERGGWAAMCEAFLSTLVTPRSWTVAPLTGVSRLHLARAAGFLYFFFTPAALRALGTWVKADELVVAGPRQ